VSRCSFCDKTAEEVLCLIEGRVGCFICDECVRLCVNIVATHRPPGETEYRSWFPAARIT
jgi:ATP-dependent protease Clp ATPase subunit